MGRDAFIWRHWLGEICRHHGPRMPSAYLPTNLKSNLTPSRPSPTTTDSI
jgi:hypothetical protein